MPSARTLSEGFGVVRCDTCETLVVIDATPGRETLDCPHCATTHQASSLRVLAQAETQVDAREVRSRVAADLAGVDDYGTEDHYAEQQADAEAYLADSLGPLGNAEIDTTPDGAWALEAEAEAALERHHTPLETQSGPSARQSLPEAESNRSLGETTGQLRFVDTPALGGTTVSNPTTASELWQQLVSGSDGVSAFGKDLVRAARQFASTVEGSRIQVYDALVEAGVAGIRTAEPVVHLGPDGSEFDAGLFPATVCDLAASSPADDDFWNAIRVLRGLGRGSFGHVASTRRDIRDGPLRLLALTDIQPTVSVRLDRTFREQKREQRRGVCELLSWLAEVADLRLVTTHSMQWWLRNTHRGDLPVSGDAEAPRPSEQTPENVAAQLDPDSREVKMLRDLVTQPAHSLQFAEWVEMQTVSASRCRQVKGTLRVPTDDDDDALGCITEYHQNGGTFVEATQFGIDVLDAVDTIYGVQKGLDDLDYGAVNDDATSAYDSRVSPRTHGDHTAGEEATPAEAPPEVPDRRRMSRLHQTRYYSRKEAVPALAAAADGGVQVSNYPVEPQEDRAQPLWGAPDESTLLVGAEADNRMALWVCLAHSLTDHRTWTQLLTEDRLADSELDDLITSGKAILRGGRCLGDLPDDVESAVEYAERLQEWRDDLLEMTGKLAREEVDDVDQFRGEIQRDAMGLAGTMVHVLDLFDIDVTIEVRVPQWTDNRRIDLDELARTMAIGTTIMSRYGHHSVYRQLFEARDEHRKWALEPTVDATAPECEPLVSWSLVGDWGEGAAPADLEHALESAFENPAAVHEEAPDLRLDVPISVGWGPTLHSRRAFANVATKLGAAKNLHETQEAVTLLHGIARTPYDAADALFVLGQEPDDKARELAPRDIRYGLSQLDPSRLLRGERPSMRQTLAALLDAETPFDSKAAVAEAAGLSRGSVCGDDGTLATLRDLGIVSRTDSGWRVRLPRSSSDEYDDTTPSWPCGLGVPGADATTLSALRVKYGYPNADASPVSEAPPEVQRLTLDAPEAWCTDLAVILLGFVTEETMEWWRFDGSLDGLLYPPAAEAGRSTVNMGTTVAQQSITSDTTTTQQTRNAQ